MVGPSTVVEDVRSKGSGDEVVHVKSSDHVKVIASLCRTASRRPPEGQFFRAEYMSMRRGLMPFVWPYCRGIAS